MSEPEKSPAVTEPAPSAAPASQVTPRESSSGRVAFDARGNAVWEWRTGDEQFARDVSTTLVQRLEAPDLNLATTAIVKASKDNHAADHAAPGRRVDAARSYNPYNHAAVDISRLRASGRPQSKSAVTRASVSAHAGPLQRLRKWFGFS